ncbi:glutathione S-transferase N-terminal domain-containing protein [Bradyrhizobium sp. Ash2021]|uniref:glutathione S-transferase N-terminal domain-containing protein n=1 Tax=Bradyrhizobium sp. Ash2021 TaxID=2954771 RepID=UPI002814D3F0|nr:glutathione S-transferase N-terminal domain-containing protein [Bradyrhizobium sp. Ash2021]WMT74609.1 glutathione S-transferase N-terminal domain-containing protein [Bradyrhizobium sp. Ash2021]
MRGLDHSPLWCCAELGLSRRHLVMGGEYGGTDDPEYIAMNPNRLVPTIDDDGFLLWESNVIVRYLSQRYGVDSLFPSALDRRFDAERWMDWQATTLWPALRPVFIGLIRTPLAERNPIIQKAAEDHCANTMRILDARLSNRAYLGGDAFSMADIPAGASAYRWYTLDIVHPQLPHLERWYADLTQRPGFRNEVMLPLS